MAPDADQERCLAHFSITTLDTHYIHRRHHEKRMTSVDQNPQHLLLIIIYFIPPFFLWICSGFGWNDPILREILIDRHPHDPPFHMTYKYKAAGCVCFRFLQLFRFVTIMLEGKSYKMYTLVLPLYGWRWPTTNADVVPSFRMSTR